jgi:hypothetical protein
MTRLPFNQSPEDLLRELESVRAAWREERARTEVVSVKNLRRQDRIIIGLLLALWIQSMFWAILPVFSNREPPPPPAVEVTLASDVPRGSWWERFWRHDVPGITLKRRVRTMAPA